MLSIIIPTYNRKEKLLRNLSLLDNLGYVDSCEIIVLDNNSDQCLQKVVNDIYQGRVLYHRQKINTGLCHALIYPFLHCQTNWLWVLGDDDEPEMFSKDLLNILRYTKSDFLKFSIFPEEDKYSTKIITLGELCVEYEGHDYTTGELLFVSNGIYNYKSLLDKGLLKEAFEYSHTAIGHLMPIIFGLSKNQVIYELRSERLVSTNISSVNSYALTWVTKRLSYLSDIQFTKDLKLQKRLVRLFQYRVWSIKITNAIISNKDIQDKYSYFLSIYRAFFSNRLFGFPTLILYYLSLILRINPFRILLNLRKKLGNISSSLLSIELKRRIKNTFPQYKHWY